MADTVPRAVQVVDAAFPHGASGEYVKLGAASPGREVGILKLQMAFQHQRIVGLFLFGERAEGESAGDVGGAIQVLRTTI